MSQDIPTRAMLTSVIEVKDEIDKIITNDIAFLPSYLNAEVFLFWGDKEKSEKHFGHVLNVAKQLAKVNDAARGYKQQEVVSLQEYEDRCSQQKNGNNAFSARHAPELERQLDYFLTGIKASLDCLAQSLEPVTGQKIHTWSTATVEGKKNVRGGNIINSLQKNTPDKHAEKIKRLTDFILRDEDWISYLIKLRDDYGHYGGLKNISQIMYDSELDKVVAQYISHNNKHYEPVSDFLERTSKHISEYVCDFLCELYLAYAPSDMFISRDKETGLLGWYIKK